MSYYVVAHYADSDAYGGPEEGGWWYRTSELIDVVQGSRFEELMWDECRRLHDKLPVDRLGRREVNEHYEVVELGRRELVPGLREQSCHLDFEPKDEDYMTVWDVPEYLPESRPHYC